MQTQLQKRRLRKLARFLRNYVSDKNFDLDIIVRAKKYEEEDETYDSLESKRCGRSPQYKCGYAACAIGHMPLAFTKTFCYTQNDLGDIFVSNLSNHKEDFEAAKEYFGIDEITADLLFTPDSYPSHRRGRLSVAERLEYFARTGQII